MFSQHCFIVILTQEKHVGISTVAIKKSINKMIKQNLYDHKKMATITSSPLDTSVIWGRCHKSYHKVYLQCCIHWSFLLSLCWCSVYPQAENMRQYHFRYIHFTNGLLVFHVEMPLKKINSKDIHHFGTKSGINLTHFLTLLLSACVVAIFLDWKHIANITML